MPTARGRGGKLLKCLSCIKADVVPTLGVDFVGAGLEFATRIPTACPAGLGLPRPGPAFLHCANPALLVPEAQRFLDNVA